MSRLHQRFTDGDKAVTANTVTSQIREDSMDAIQPIQSQDSPLSVPSNPVSRESANKDEVCICMVTDLLFLKVITLCVCVCVCVCMKGGWGD